MSNIAPIETFIKRDVLLSTSSNTVLNMLSIIIPSRNEQFLKNTILDLLGKAGGEIEIIAVLDGYWPPSEEIINNDKVIYLHKGKSEGMRKAINSGMAISKGEYVMKCDGHCMFDKDFDLKLKENCEDNWVVVPTRKRLDAENWAIQDVGKPDIDYMYLSYPDDPLDRGGCGLHGKLDNGKNADLKLRDDKIVDLMSAQGSCYFMKRKYFYELELLDHENYGPFGSEFQEVGLKCWLSGGRVVRNKNIWYAHLHKGKKYGRGYFLNNKHMNQANEFTNKWIKGEAWGKQTKPLSWLIEKFMPIPTWDEAKLKKLKKQEHG